MYLKQACVTYTVFYCLIELLSRQRWSSIKQLHPQTRTNRDLEEVVVASSCFRVLRDVCSCVYLTLL